MTAPAPTSQAPRLVPPGVEYHRVLAGEKRRIGRGILAIALLFIGMFGATALLSIVASWADGLLRSGGEPGSMYTSPVLLASGLIGVALLIPFSMIIQRWLYGVSPASLHSVESRFRFDLFGRALVLIVPLLAVALSVTEFVEPAGTGVWDRQDIIGVFLVVVLLVPLQAAGEEYGLRGLVFRVAGSWARGRTASLVIGIAMSALVFAVLHLAADPWWNVLYVVVSVATALVTWRTGGIEIAVVIHSVFNVLYFSLGLVPHADLADRFDRSVGAMTPALFVPVTLALAIIVAVVWVRTRRSGPVTTPST
ncbi:CPBP family intramembrane metalloprotease [Isoptericola halotolerans]|uniref:Membrane protease YdiL (CAAX protease family) n=1 Tax=Isoptericola halotolerans TaxID=300560 RepID=A0ABX2A9A0_9MICO|nr:type II CAAX endopeptidase family protein [Isoptericola halotolerans]NOV98598.1 membrane protease YdiL (CAAX protease family) [Isoptericola halotolerans]